MATFTPSHTANDGVNKFLFYLGGKELERGSFAGGREETFLPQSSGNFPFLLLTALLTFG